MIRLLEPLWPVARVAVYAVGLWLLADVVLLRTSPEDGWALFGEHGILEHVQVALLVLHALLAIALLRRSPRTRSMAVLFLGAACTSLIREHNNDFKVHLGPYVWQSLAGAVLLAALIVALRTGRGILAGLKDLTQRPAFGWMAAGVVLLLYGQVLDERSIWVLLLGPDVPYAAQRMAEECVETAGYWLIGAGLFEWWLTAPRDAGDAETDA